MFPENDRAIKDVLKESSCSPSFSYRYSSRLGKYPYSFFPGLSGIILWMLPYLMTQIRFSYSLEVGREQQSIQAAECSFITFVAKKGNYQVQRLSQAAWHTAAQWQKHADVPMLRPLASTAPVVSVQPIHKEYDSSVTEKVSKLLVWDHVCYLHNYM